MGVNINPLAGQPARPDMLVDVLKLVTAYFTGIPDPACAAERVAFGTSGHRGSSFERSFNERHILAIAQAICLYREKHGIGGPLFLGMDTHALSVRHCPALLRCLPRTTWTSSSRQAATTRRRRRSRVPSSLTIAAAIEDTPTVSSSRLRTIHQRAAASNTIRRMAVRRNRTLPFG
jgi:hypothetical protein